MRRACGFFAVLIAGCGGGATGSPAHSPSDKSIEPEAPADSTQERAAEGYAQPGQPGYAPGQPAPTATSPQAPQFAEPPPREEQGPKTDTARPALDRAVLDFDRAATELEAGGSDCTRVCKALGSMQRAADRICALDPDDAASGRCKRARGRVTNAEERVRSRCTC